MSEQLALALDIDAVNAQLSSALAIRCDLHQRRERGVLTIYEYVLGLAWVRAQEAELEPVRRRAGYNFARAWELVTARTDYRGPSATADETAPRAGIRSANSHTAFFTSVLRRQSFA